MSDPIVPTDYQAIQEDLQTITESKQLLDTELEVSMASEGIIGDMFASIASGFNTLVDKIFRLKVNGTPIEDAKPNLKLELDANSKISSRNFVDFSGIEFQSMEGFKGSYLEYAKHSVISLGFYKESLSGAMKTYETLLGALISNSSSRVSYEDTTATVKASAMSRQAADTAEQNYWVAGNHQVVAKVGSVIGSAGEVKEIQKHLKTIKSMLGDGSLKEIKTRIQRMDTMVDHFSTGIGKGKFQDITKAQVNNIATDLEEMARQVEHYALTVYRAHVFLQAVERLQEKVDKLL